ncbi:M14-type cytosolic carboxypeptidase, partial [Pseudomonas aeruginosa]|uniref:M14-type cytosolic carboxypeptidase n=1 Tax=Pseudomonas aeruginosa TaxID=287 RepID=UPI002021D067
MPPQPSLTTGTIPSRAATTPRRIRLPLRPGLASQHFQWFSFKVEGMAAAPEH